MLNKIYTRTINKLSACALFALIGASSAFAAPANDNFANAQTVTGMVRNVLGNNTDATSEQGEPLLTGVSGGKTIWFKWTAPFTRKVQITTNRTTGNMNTVLGVFTGSAVNDLTPICQNDNIANAGNYRSICHFLAVGGTTYYISVDGHADPLNVPQGFMTLDIKPITSRSSSDFGNNQTTDGVTDFSVFRPSNGTWYVNNSSTLPSQMFAMNFGQAGDVPVPAPYTSGSSTDLGVFRPSTGTWYIYKVNYAQPFKAVQWGQEGDIPMPGFYEGEGASNLENIDGANIAVFRPSNGTWYIRRHNGQMLAVQFGQAGDVPVVADFDEDNKHDIAVFRPSNGTWYINGSVDGLRAVQFGADGDIPVAGDYDGDALADVAVFRPSNGTWYVLRSSNNQMQAYKFGLGSDIPRPGDYDGDGKTDFAVFRPSNNTWYALQSSNGQLRAQQWGANEDIPVSSRLIF